MPQIPHNEKNWPSSGVGSSITNSMSGGRKRFHTGMQMEIIINAMLDPMTGLNRRNNTQLNLTISDSFSGQDLINWLADNVEGLEDRKNCEKYSGELLRHGFIEQKFKKNSFTA
jgi:segment polarity protein dishevelled